MRELYDLNDMLKEIESESNVSASQKKNQLSNQEDISKLFPQKKLGSSKLGKKIEPENSTNQADK